METNHKKKTFQQVHYRRSYYGGSLGPSVVSNEFMTKCFAIASPDIYLRFRTYLEHLETNNSISYVDVKNLDLRRVAF